MSDVGSDRLRNTQGFLTKNVKRNILGPEILVGSHKMSENSGVGSHRFHCNNNAWNFILPEKLVSWGFGLQSPI